MNLLKSVGFGAAVARFALAFMPAMFGQDQAARSKPVFLDQGWSEEDRLAYYLTSHGSAVMFYDIFLNLEVASREGNYSVPTRTWLATHSFRILRIRNTILTAKKR